MTDVASDACRKVRSGVADGWACVTHGRAWPCSVRGQAAEQLSLLHRASPLAPPVLLEVAAERLHQLELVAPGMDDERAAHAWVELMVDYLNRASDAGRLIAGAVEAGADPDLSPWRRRLIQVAAIACAAVESCDRVMARTLPTERT